MIHARVELEYLPQMRCPICRRIMFLETNEASYSMVARYTCNLCHKLYEVLLPTVAAKEIH